MVEGNVRLRAQRLARRWTQEDFVAAFEVAARRLGVPMGLSVRQFKRWESAEPPWPSLAAQRVLEGLLGLPVTALGFTPPAGWPVVGKVSVTAGQLALTVGGEGVGEDAVLRRAFVGSVPAVFALPPAGDVPRGQIGMCEVRQVQATTHQLQVLSDRIGGDSLFRVAAQQFQHAQGLLNVSHRPSLAPALYDAVGHLAALTGWLAHDAAQREDTHAYLTTGLYLARLAESTELELMVYNLMGLQALGRKERPAEGLQLAVRGQELAASRGTARLRALFAMREAQAHAVLNDPAAARKAMATAWQHWERVDPGHEDPSWLAFFDKYEMRSLRAICDMNLRSFGPAARTLGDVVAESGQQFARNNANRAALLANARLAQRDVDGACVAAGEALRPDVSSGRTRALITEFVTALGRHQRTPIAADFLDRWRSRVSASPRAAH